MALSGPGNHKRKRVCEEPSDEISIDDPEEAGGLKQMKISSGPVCSQKHFNDLLVKWVVKDYQSFSIVESPHFCELIKAAGSGPVKTVISCKTLMSSIEGQFQAQKLRLFPT
jgi:hypothetical protein